VSTFAFRSLSVRFRCQWVSTFAAFVHVRCRQPCFDDCLYDPGKSALTATLARSADATGDAGLRALALDLTTYSLQRIAAEPLPVGKIPGDNFGRLTSAVARLARGVEPPGQIFADGFEVTP